MSLSSVLVDRGRALTNVEKMQHNADGTLVPVRIEGTTQMVWQYGPYFDCRIDSPAAPKRRDSAGGRDRTAQSPIVMFDVYDDNDDPVVLHAESRIEVESDAFGTQVWELTGEPELMRKKYDLVCGQANVVRILDFGLINGPITQLADGGTALIHVNATGTSP